ncbi:MAG: SDR family NAD(P)-dependent oxidoreductase [Geminicoccaceae bacterium]
MAVEAPAGGIELADEGPQRRGHEAQGMTGRGGGHGRLCAPIRPRMRGRSGRRVDRACSGGLVRPIGCPCSSGIARETYDVVLARSHGLVDRPRKDVRRPSRGACRRWARIGRQAASQPSNSTNARPNEGCFAWAELAGRIAPVTGAARGIGAAIARRLAAEGASVAITYGKSADAAARRRTVQNALVAFVAGPDAAYITAAGLTVDGGPDAWRAPPAACR